MRTRPLFGFQCRSFSSHVRIARSPAGVPRISDQFGDLRDPAITPYVLGQIIDCPHSLRAMPAGHPCRRMRSPGSSNKMKAQEREVACWSASAAPVIHRSCSTASGPRCEFATTPCEPSRPTSAGSGGTSTSTLFAIQTRWGAPRRLPVVMSREEVRAVLSSEWGVRPDWRAPLRIGAAPARMSDTSSQGSRLPPPPAHREGRKGK